MRVLKLLDIFNMRNRKENYEAVMPKWIKRNFQENRKLGINQRVSLPNKKL